MYVETEETLPPRTLAEYTLDLNRRASESFERAKKVREDAGAYLDEASRWDRVRESVKAAGSEAAGRTPDNNTVRRHLAAALAVVQPLPEPGRELATPDGWDGVEVTLRVVSQLRYSILDRPIAMAADLEEGSRERDEAMLEASRAFVAATVAEVKGLKKRGGEDLVIKGDPLDADALRVLEVAGLLLPLFNVAKGAQSIDPFSRAAFGSAPPSTSPSSSSTAPDAPRGTGSGRAATEEETTKDDRPGSQARATRPTPAPGATSSAPESMPPSPASTRPKAASGLSPTPG